MELERSSQESAIEPIVAVTSTASDAGNGKITAMQEEVASIPPNRKRKRESNTMEATQIVKKSVKDRLGPFPQQQTEEVAPSQIDKAPEPTRKPTFAEKFGNPSLKITVSNVNTDQSCGLDAHSKQNETRRSVSGNDNDAISLTGDRTAAAPPLERETRDPRLKPRRLSASDVRDNMLSAEVQNKVRCRTQSQIIPPPQLQTIALPQMMNVKRTIGIGARESQKPEKINIIKFEGDPYFEADSNFPLPPFLMQPKFSKYGAAILFPKLCFSYMDGKCSLNEDRCPWKMKHQKPSSEELRERMDISLPEDVGQVFSMLFPRNAAFFQEFLLDFSMYFGKHKMTDLIFDAIDICLQSKNHSLANMKHCIAGLWHAGLQYRDILNKVIMRIDGTDKTRWPDEHYRTVLSLILDPKYKIIGKFVKVLRYYANHHLSKFNAEHINAMLQSKIPEIDDIKWNIISNIDMSAMGDAVNQNDLNEFIEQYNNRSM